MHRLLLLVAMLVACSAPDEKPSRPADGPRETLEHFLHARFSGDTAKARSLLVAEDRAYAPNHLLEIPLYDWRHPSIELVARPMVSWAIASVDASGAAAVAKVLVWAPDCEGAAATFPPGKLPDLVDPLESELQDIGRATHGAKAPRYRHELTYVLEREPAGWRVRADLKSRDEVMFGLRHALSMVARADSDGRALLDGVAALREHRHRGSEGEFLDHVLNESEDGLRRALARKAIYPNSYQQALSSGDEDGVAAKIRSAPVLDDYGERRRAAALGWLEGRKKERAALITSKDLKLTWRKSVVDGRDRVEGTLTANEPITAFELAVLCDDGRRWPCSASRPTGNGGEFECSEDCKITDVDVVWAYFGDASRRRSARVDFDEAFVRTRPARPHEIADWLHQMAYFVDCRAEIDGPLEVGFAVAPDGGIKLASAQRATLGPPVRACLSRWAQQGVLPTGGKAFEFRVPLARINEPRRSGSGSPDQRAWCAYQLEASYP